jgi:glycosyltransferase involved in cell wall biosynthesis
MAKQPHICLIAPLVFPVLTGDRNLKVIGGAEVQQNFIARGLRAAGYPVSILTGDFGQLDDLEFDGLRVLKMRQQGRTFPVLRYFHPRLTSIWSAMRRANADIYYQRCAGVNTFVAGLYAKTHGKRFVYAAAHDLDLDRPRTREIFPGSSGWRDLPLYLAGLKIADAIIAQHPGQVEACRRWHRREAEWIPSGYVPSASAHCEPEGVVLWVSTMRNWKRPELFLKLAQSLPDLRFRMVGGVSTAEGDRSAQGFFSEIEVAARALPNVEFVGFVPYQEVERHFDEASLFVNTSDYEGFPNTFLQAWARGIPTVSFVNCGAKDARGPIGVVANDLNEMQAAVSRLAADRAAWSEESARCRQYFQANHAMPAVITRYRALFDRLAVPA